jgi:SagB-type dehydrogenase family enzyme
VNEGIGDRYQEETKYTRESLKGGMLDWENKPETYKEYADSKQVELPPFDSIKTSDVMDALKERRSIRHYSGKPLSLEELSYLLWASCGIQRVERGNAFRTAPSAGALYPIETYVLVDAVDGVEPGAYHYSVRTHRLEQLRTGNLGHDIVLAALNQKMCIEAAAVFIWTAVFRRSKWKYKERAYRYIYLDAGHIAGNLTLAATAVGLGTCQIGAIFDDEVNAIIGVDGQEESAIYLSLVGHPI